MSAPEEEDFRAGPLSERLVSPKWKVRQYAYEDLQSLFTEALEDTAPVFNTHASAIKAILTDKNVVAQESGLLAVITWIDRCPNATKNAGAISKLLVEKCLGGRNTQKDRAIDALLMLIEREAGEAVISALLEGSNNKVPKIAAMSIFALSKCIEEFGVQDIPVKLVLKSMCGLFDNSNAQVRAEATNLVVELYRWLGDIMNRQIENLRPAQVKELSALFSDEKPNSRVPKRYLRSKGPSVGSAAAAPEQPKEVDVYSILEEKEILSKIGDKWFENLESKKWQERKESLDELYNLADSPKLANGDYNAVGKALKKVMQKDANVMCVQRAAEAAKVLAVGLRSAFTPIAKGLFPAMLEKLKENKPTVITALQEAMEAMHLYCFTLAEILPDMIPVMANHKVPKVRLETTKFLVTCLSTPQRNMAASKCVKDIGLNLIKLLDDSNADVREQAAKAFGALCGVIGERALQPYLAKLDEVRVKKVKEFYPGASSASTAPAASAPAATAARTSPVASSVSSSEPAKNTLNVSDISPESSATTSANIKKPVSKTKPQTQQPKEQKPATAPATIKPSASGGTSGTAKSGGKAKTAAATNSSSGKSSGTAAKHSILPKESALSIATELFGEETINSLSSAAWKDRLSAVQTIDTHVKKLEESKSLAGQTDALVRLFESAPGFKETNFQVFKTMLSIVTYCAQSVDNFSVGAAEVIISGSLDKLADVKVGPTLCECLTAMVECVGPNSIIENVLTLANDNKNPKVTESANKWIITTLQEFGTRGVNIKNLVDYCKACLESRNPAVRSTAISLLGVMRQSVGPAIRDFVADLKPAQLQLVDKEFATVSDAPVQQPTRSLRGQAAVEMDALAANGGGELPREDISSKITPDLIAKIGHKDWKERKSGLNDVQAIIEAAHKRIEPKIGSLPAALKPRLADSNKNLVPLTLTVIAEIATAMGPQVEKHLRTLIAPVLQCFLDSNKKIVTSAIECLDAVVKEITFKPFLKEEMTPALMAIDSSQSRKEAAAWINKYIMDLPNGVDVSLLIKPTIKGLEDKAPETRKQCEILLGEVMRRTSYDSVKKHCKDLSRASMLNITPLLEKLRVAAEERNAELARTQLQAERNASAVSTNAQKAQAQAVVETPHTSIPVPIEAAAEPPLKTTSKEKRIATPARTNKPKSSLSPVQKRKNIGDYDDGLQLPKTISNATASGEKSQLCRNDQKNKRGLEARKKPWNTDSLSKSDEKELMEELRKYVSSALLQNMFSDNKEDIMNALECLEMSAQNHYDDLVDSLDLILKWITIRIYQVDILEEMAQFIHSIFSVLASQGYHLSEYEAESFLPHFCKSFSNLSKADGDLTHEITRKICSIYPSSKLISFFLKALDNHPSEDIAAACLNELSSLIATNGVQQSACPSNVQIVLSMVQSCDDFRTRKAAATFLAEIHRGLQKQGIADGVWKYINSCAVSISEGDRAFFEKIFEEHANAPAPVFGSKVEGTPARAKKRTAVAKSNNGNTTPFKAGAGSSSTPFTPSSTRAARRETVPATTMRRWFDSISDGCLDEEKSICALKELCASIEANTVPPVHADKILEVLTNQLQSVIQVDHPSARYCKCLINSLITLFSEPEFAKNAGIDLLRKCLTEVLLELQHPAVGRMEDSGVIMKAMNHLVAKILENSDRTLSFVVLIQLLREAVTAGSNRAKFTDFVMKCILKLTTTLKVVHESLDLKTILWELHLFVEENPPADAMGTMPFKTIKTVVNEIAKVQGAEVFDNLDKVPEDSHLRMMLKNMVKAHNIKSTKTSSDVVAQPSTSNAQLSPADKKIKLVRALKALNDPQSSEEGFAQLKKLRTEYPDITLKDIQGYLEKNTPVFREFVQRAWATVSSDVDSTSAEIEQVQRQQQHDNYNQEEEEQDENEIATFETTENSDPGENISRDVQSNVAASNSLSNLFNSSKNSNSSIPATQSSCSANAGSLTNKSYATSSNTSVTAADFLEKLKRLQQKGGVTTQMNTTNNSNVLAPTNTNTVATQPNVSSLAEIRQKLEKAKTQLNTQSIRPVPDSTLQLSEDSFGAKSKPQSTATLSDIKNRLRELSSPKQ